MAERFTDVTMTRRDDSLEVTDSGPVVEYALSSDLYDLSGDRASRLAELVECEIVKHGRFSITKEAGLLEARKQR